MTKDDYKSKGRRKRGKEALYYSRDDRARAVLAIAAIYGHTFGNNYSRNFYLNFCIHCGKLAVKQTIGGQCNEHQHQACKACDVHRARDH